MADHHLLDTTYTDSENVLHLWNDDSSYPIFADLEPPPPLSQLHSSPTSNDDIASPCNPLEDPLTWDFDDDLCESLMETLDDSNSTKPVNPDEDNAQHINMAYENTKPLAVWPPVPIPFSCSCCQVLREIIHCNGTLIARLEIHGRVGIICHAIKEIRNNFDSLAPTVEYVIIDFSTQSIESVKQYLVQYCQEQRQAGFVMSRDPLSAFYDALCAGQSWDESNNTAEDFIQEFQIQTGFHPMSKQEEENGDNRLTKSGLAAQVLQSEPTTPWNLGTRSQIEKQMRERTANMDLKDLQPYFHLPIEEAAKQLVVCPTVLKRICRKHELQRWPHRKIKSLDRQIANLELSLTARNGEDDMRTQSQIERLRQERDKICTIK